MTVKNKTKAEFKSNYCSLCGERTLHDDSICIKCCLKEGVSKNWIKKWCQKCSKDTLHHDSACHVCEDERADSET